MLAQGPAGPRDVVGVEQAIGIIRRVDPLGPTRQEWRDGDSAWALVEDGELASAIAKIESMTADGSTDQFHAEREALRRQHGQATYVIARKPL